MKANINIEALDDGSFLLKTRIYIGALETIKHNSSHTTVNEVIVEIEELIRTSFTDNYLR